MVAVPRPPGVMSMALSAVSDVISADSHGETLGLFAEAADLIAIRLLAFGLVFGPEDVVALTVDCPDQPPRSQLCRCPADRQIRDAILLSEIPLRTQPCTRLQGAGPNPVLDVIGDLHVDEIRPLAVEFEAVVVLPVGHAIKVELARGSPSFGKLHRAIDSSIETGGGVGPGVPGSQPASPSNVGRGGRGRCRGSHHLSR